MGYKPVKTFSPNVLDESKYATAEDAGYFVYNTETASYDEALIGDDTSITDRDSFTKALDKYGNIYIKICNKVGDKLVARGQVEGYNAETGITTLAEYFHWLKELSNISTIDDLNYGRKFTRLPLSEPHFTIDANTRAITIPAEFRKNGIAVQGDDLAEVVYFEIDRYYDYMDFANCEIAIQWETARGKNRKGETVEAVTSISQPYLVDIESEPGKLIFGWAISDVLTDVAGTLKFSVRFYQFNEKNEIAYNFNTLTATTSVKSGLYIDITNLSKDDIDDVGDRLIERIENSQLVEGGYVAATPVFIINLINEDEPNEERDLDAENGIYTLTALAEAADTGMIVYNWKRQDLTDTSRIINLIGKIDYRKVAEPKVGESYYIANSESNYVLTQITDDNYDNYKDKAYERLAQCDATEAGIYWVDAENRITNSSASALSDKVTFPLPEKPEIINHLVENVAIKENDEDDGIYYTDDLEEQVANSSYTLELDTKKVDKNIPAYNWERSDDNENWRETEDTDLKYEITAPGYYRMSMKNTRNKAETEKVYSNVCRVTYVPKELELEQPANELLVISVNALSDDNCPKVEIKDTGIKSDGHIVEWYVYETVGDITYNEKVITFILSKDEWVSTFNPANPDYQAKIQELTHDSNILAQYYPVVYNRLNGVRSKGVSFEEPPFRVTKFLNENVVTLSLDDNEDDKLFFED